MDMIEDLLDDKKQLSAKIEELINSAKDQQHSVDKHKKVTEDHFTIELKKNKEAWVASEKVRRERWEQSKVAEIRA